jgi:hypothetical protein
MTSKLIIMIVRHLPFLHISHHVMIPNSCKGTQGYVARLVAVYVGGQMVPKVPKYVVELVSTM